MPRETPIVPNLETVIIEQGKATIEFQTWMSIITDLVNEVPPLVGSGSPEGIVTATEGRWYVDQDTVGTGIYLKEVGDDNTGWVKRS